MIPIFYINDRLRLGALSGSQSSTFNPKERLADGAITLGYTTTAGVTPSGQFEVELGTADQPDSLIVARGFNLSGTAWQVESEDVGGGNNANVASGDVVGSPSFFVLPVTPGTDRAVWRVIATGANGATQVKSFEVMLADKVTLPRAVAVGVSRDRLRQFSRIAIPGSQAFTKRDGPRLRRTSYGFVVTSGSEVNTVRSLIDTIEGGEAFFHTDDLGQSYWAELMGNVQSESDNAGVSSFQFTVQEIASD